MAKHDIFSLKMGLLCSTCIYTGKRYTQLQTQAHQSVRMPPSELETSNDSAKP